MQKVCNTCKRTFPATIDYFTRRSDTKDGLAYQCKECSRAKSRKYYNENAKTFTEKKREWKKRNPKKVKEAARRYAETHPEVLREKAKRYRKRHPERIAKRDRQLKEQKPELINQRKRAWEAKNKERVNECRRQRLEERMQDKEFAARYRLDLGMAVAIWDSLNGKKNGRSWEELVGYTLNDLMKHLEGKFLPGMTWENRAKKGWHIDHIKPKSSFNYTLSEDPEFKECWALENLQPLWWIDNIRKGCKIS